MTIDISNMDKAEVLCALHSRATVQGMGFLHPGCMNNLTYDEAVKALETRKYFDYCNGRVMKIDLGGEGVALKSIRTDLYNRDNGDNAAEDVIKELRDKKIKKK